MLLLECTTKNDACIFLSFPGPTRIVFFLCLRLCQDFTLLVTSVNFHSRPLRFRGFGVESLLSAALTGDNLVADRMLAGCSMGKIRYALIICSSFFSSRISKVRELFELLVDTSENIRTKKI